MSRKGGGGMAQASASFRFCRHERGKGKRQQAGKGLHHHPLTSFQVDHSHGNEMLLSQIVWSSSVCATTRSGHVLA